MARKRDGTLQFFQYESGAVDVFRRPPRPISRGVETPISAYGMRDYQRVGSMTDGSKILTLTESSTFQVGDQIIVEIGGEAGAGAYLPAGSVGVGGIYPAGAGVQDYYFDFDAPRALVAIISAVSNNGSTLTLDTEASTATVNANVYFDNVPIVQSLLSESHGSGWVITYSAGRFAMSKYVSLESKNGWTIQGQGKTQTVFFVPRGGMSARIFPNSCQNCIIQDLAIEGNFGDEGFGYGTDGLPIGILGNLCTNMTVRRIATRNFWVGAISFANSSNINVSDCNHVQDDPHRSYFAQWFYSMTDSATGTFTRCNFTSPWLNSGYEAFRSSGVNFIDCTSVNGVLSSNSSGAFLIDGFNLTVTAGAYISDAEFHKLNPLININSNIQPPDTSMLVGGTITNCNVTCHAQTIGGNYFKGVVVNADNPNINIENCLFTYIPENVVAGFPTIEVEALGITSTGENTNVFNCTVVGINFTFPFPYNISVTDGSVTNCTANSISCQLPNCVLTPGSVARASLAGSGNLSVNATVVTP